jgi:hypothetical protein
LRDLHPLTGKGNYVFPGARTNGRPMSENTINAGLRRLGYAGDQMTGHGFRSMASTLLNEQGAYSHKPRRPFSSQSSSLSYFKVAGYSRFKVATLARCKIETHFHYRSRKYNCSEPDQMGFPGDGSRIRPLFSGGHRSCTVHIP